MKKYLLKLGVIWITTLPLLSMVSCINGSLNAIDLEINIPKDKNVTQENINIVAEALQIEGIATEKKIDLLNTVFENVDAGKFNHFKIKIEQQPSNVNHKVISLNANDGFIFGNKKVLRSQEVKVPGIIDLNIQALEEIDQPIIDQAIVKLNSIISLEEKVLTLNTVFQGVTIDNVNNFDVEAIPTNGKVLGTIKLTAKTGFSFNGQDTLSSLLKWNLNIRVIPKLQKYIDHVIKRWNEPSNLPSEKVAILSMIFEGVTEANINNFNVEVIPTAGTTFGKVTLIAKGKFNFNGKPTLTSEMIPEVDLGLTIQAIPKIQEEIDNVIKTWNNTLAIPEKVRILLTIFEGISPENIINFNVEVTPTTESTPGIVSLIAKEGFNFNGNPTLLSKVLDNTVDLKIGHQKITQYHLDLAIMQLITGVDKYEVLQLVFSGITQENVNHLIIKPIPTNGETLGKIILTGKKGFTINGKPSLESVIVKEDLQITALKKTQEEIDNVIKTWNNALAISEKVRVLSIIFAGVTEAKINNFNVEVTPTSGNIPGKVTLIAKGEFSFNGNPTLTSLKPEMNLGSIIKPIPKTQNIVEEVIKGWNQNSPVSEKVSILSKIFQGITQENIDNFNVEVTPTAGNTPGKVTLIAKEGFNFNLKPTLISIIDLIIGPIRNPQDNLDHAITRLNLNANPAWQILSGTIFDTGLKPSFTGVTEQNVNYLTIKTTVSNVDKWGTITLIAKEGFTINGQPSVVSLTSDTSK